MKPLNIAVFGAGEWGKNYLRLLRSHPRVGRLLAVEIDHERRDWLQAQFPGLETQGDVEKAWDSDFECAVIALPATQHFEYLERAIAEHKHVLIEKPAVVSMVQADRINQLVSDYEGTVMVGHVFLYNPGIMKLKQSIDEGAFDPIYFMRMVRMNLGPIRPDVDCFYDLAPHDISIMLHLLGRMPTEVSAIGSAFLTEEKVDVGFASYRFPSGAVVSIQVSWLAPTKARELTIVSENRMAIFDDTAAVEKLRIYDRGVNRAPYQDFGVFQMIVREGDVHIPHLSPLEPLMNQVNAFLHAVTSNTQPVADWKHGFDVVRVLCATEQSLENNGAPITI